MRYPRTALSQAGAPGALLVAAPPPWLQSRYMRAGYLPTHRKLTVLGRSLDPGLALPERPHFDLGDLDFT